ncbi:MAG: DoxX family protein [bacterium]|jgi:hypothetical protein|nr:DoxX family protein [bacterium]
MNKIKLAHQISKGLLSTLLLMGVGMYFFNYEMVSEMYTSLGYPTYIIYPLAVAKLLAVIALWQNKCSTTKEWAYAGLFFVLILAISAHINVGDGQYGGATAALILLAISYKTSKKLKKSK